MWGECLVLGHGIYPLHEMSVPSQIKSELCPHDIIIIAMGTAIGDPPTKILGEQQVNPAPHFFCNLQLKVTSQTYFNTKILENSPASGDPIVLRKCVYLFR